MPLVHFSLLAESRTPHGVGGHLQRDTQPASVTQVAQIAREDEILLVGFASTTQALVKVRVRLSAMVFVDHLTWHRIDGRWLITSKGFHVESDDSQSRPSAGPSTT